MPALLGRRRTGLRPLLTVDTETRGLIYREGVGSVFMVQWADAHREYVCTEDTGWRPFLDAIAANHDGLLVFANASFDMHHLRASGIIDLLAMPGIRCHDVITLARVCIPGRFGYKLEQLGTDLLGADTTVAQRELKAAAKKHGVRWTQKDKDYYGLWKLEPELMEKYGREDVRLTWDVWQKIWSRALKSDIEVYRMEIAEVAPLLRAAERDGVLVDTDKLAVLKARLLVERDALRESLLAGGFSEEALGVELEDEDADDGADVEYGQANAQALRDNLLAIGVPLYRKTPSSGKPKKNKDGTPKRGADGKPLVNPDIFAVNKDALQEFVKDYPVVRDLLDWRNRCKILTTYVGALERAYPRVHTWFNQVQARTSRMSSSSPNVQNLPVPEKDKTIIGVRDVLIPAPGNAFVVCDYEGIEVYTLAHFIADAELTSLLEAGVDMHQRTAFIVALSRGEKGITIDDFVKGGARDKDRTRAKVTTFTAMYGGGARLLSVRLGISVEEAAALKHEVLSAIPGYWEFDARIKHTVLRRSFPHVVTITGRRLHVPRDKPYVAMNTLIQGTAADLMKLGMIAAAPVMADLDYKIRLVVHDELVNEGPAACAPEALAAIIQSMESCYPLSPRLKVTGDWSTTSYGAAK